MNSTELLVWGTVIHLIADWLLQNHWRAVNKSDLWHPAAWVHACIHYFGMLLVFELPVAVLLALSHLIIDTRVPLRWWRKVFRQTREGEFAMPVAIWGDQVLHVALIAVAALVSGR